MNKLAERLTGSARTVFDYAAIGDAAIETQAREAVTKIRSLQQGAAVDIGRELIAIKDALPHGQFDKWVEAEFGYSKRTAVNMMQVANTLGDKYAKIAHLPQSILYKLAAPSTPIQVREAIIERSAERALDIRSVSNLIAETKKVEARKARRAAPKEPSPTEKRQAARFARTAEKLKLEQESRKANALKVINELRFWLGEHFSEFLEAAKDVDWWEFGRVMKDTSEPQTEVHDAP